MKTNRLIALTSSAWRTVRWVCAVALVLSACSGVAQAKPHPQPSPSVNSAPEIDPGSIKAGLILLGGGVLLLTDRFRRRSR
jgi:hypothetical protein